ncbi:DUF3786 domain-containing protein [bacterium]|nr:MAG: DUF3786 domain-containing protein [bacterium]
MAYKVLDILKDLPGTNCGECKKSGCYPFSISVYLEGWDLASCPHLPAGEVERMKTLIAEDRARGGGKKDPTHDQAVVSLSKKFRAADLQVMAANSGCVQAGDSLVCPFLDGSYEIGLEDVKALKGEPPSVWVKVFLYIYLTRASGAKPAGKWVSFRELPNSTSKSANFESCGEKIARHYSGHGEKLDEAVRELGGVRDELGSADRVWRLTPLPRISLLLLYWEATEEFPARATILVDKNILEYLDQEATVFLAEAISNRLCGKSVNEVIT